MDLICVVMNAPSINDRNNDARALLDFGFYGFGSYKLVLSDLTTVQVNRGKEEYIRPTAEDVRIILPKSDISRVKEVYNIESSINAPVMKGDIIGRVELFVGDEKVYETPLLSDKDILKISIFDIFLSILSGFVG